MDTVAAGVTQLRIQRFVNVYFVDAGTPDDWVLVGTGLLGSEKAIRAAAAELYGPGVGPQVIVLTNSHLDHLGAALELTTGWHVPVLVHSLERPYVTAQALHPPRNPTVGGSLAFIEPVFPDAAARPARRGAEATAGYRRRALLDGLALATCAGPRPGPNCALP